MLTPAQLLLPACLAAVLSGCGTPGSHAGPIDLASIDPSGPGVSCPRGLYSDPTRGCTGDHTKGAAAIVLRHRDEMSSAFRLVEITYGLDGRLVYHWKIDVAAGADEGTALPSEFPVFDDNAPAGEHEVTVEIAYRGYGKGVFSYLRGYRFTVRAAHAFTADPSHITTITSIGGEKKGPTLPLEERPQVTFTAFSRLP